VLLSNLGEVCSADGAGDGTLDPLLDAAGMKVVHFMAFQCYYAILIFIRQQTYFTVPIASNASGIAFALEQPSRLITPIP